MKWISVDKDLPPLHRYVLTININHEVKILRREEDGWENECCNWDNMIEITHWAELPKGPEEIK